jgi:curved DNA-binding protein CbpA
MTTNHHANLDPLAVLGVSADATDEEVRAAYLLRVKEHPPDRAPIEFERVRDAYQALSDPRRRARLRLLAADPGAPLTALLAGDRPRRRFVGPRPWLEALTKSVQG